MKTLNREPKVTDGRDTKHFIELNTLNGSRRGRLSRHRERQREREREGRRQTQRERRKKGKGQREEGRKAVEG